MAILIISNDYLKDPDVWDMLENYLDFMQILNQTAEDTTMRVLNEEVPMEDTPIDLIAYSFHEVRPFIIGFKINQHGLQA